MDEEGWWDEIYSGPKEEIPWDIGVPSEHLVDLVEKKKLKPCKALDICCGTGTEAIYLAKKRFRVSGIDVTKKAIKIAKGKAEEAKVIIDFRVGNVLEMPFKDETFDFVNDRGCFHTFAPEYRKWFADEVWRVMKEGGNYFLRCFSDKEPGDLGPYRISKQDIEHTFSDLFKILSIEDVELRGREGSHRGFKCIMKKRVEYSIRS